MRLGVDRPRDAETAEGAFQHRERFRIDVSQLQFAARDRRRGDVAARLDVVAPDARGAPFQRVHAFHDQTVRPLAFDPRTHGFQLPRQVDDMRFAGGIVYFRPPFGQNARHQKVLRRRDARLVEENVRPLQGALEPQRLAPGHRLRAQRLETGEMRIEPPVSYRVPAGGRKRRAPRARQERSGEKETCARLGGEFA